MPLPVDPSILVPFVIAVALVELTPGPNMGWLALLAARRGRAAGAAAVLGVTLGLSVYMLSAALGVAEIVVRARPVYEALRWAGIFYLLWLAWETWTGKDETLMRTGAVVDGIALRQAFVRGLIANLLNPKAAVFYLALLPTFITDGRASPLTQALTLGTIHLVVSVAVHGAIVALAANTHTLVAVDGRAKIVRKAFGAAIAAIAVWLVFTTRWDPALSGVSG